MGDVVGFGLGLGRMSEGVLGPSNWSWLDCSAVFPIFPLATLEQVWRCFKRAG